MADANPSRPGGAHIDAPRLAPNPVVKRGKPQKRNGMEFRVDELANGDKIETRVDVDRRFLRRRRGSESGQ